MARTWALDTRQNHVIEPLESRTLLASASVALAISPLANESAIAVRWDADAVRGEIGWRVQRSFDGRDFSHYVNLRGHVDHYVDDDPNLPLGMRIYYRVRAFGNGQDTPYTAKTSITTPAGAEMVSVPLSGAVESSTMILQKGVDYVLTASGHASNGGASSDAEYSVWNPAKPADTRADYDGVAPVAGGVNYGIRIRGATGGESWGAYGSSGVYTIHVTGKGTPISFQYGDDVYGDNAGALTVSIGRG